MFTDVKYALRRLIREPKFAAFAVLLLATGVAACTVMFSVVQAVLVRPYNIESPARVVVMWPVQHDLPGEFAYNAARDLRRLQSLESVASVGSTNWFGTLTLGDGRVVGVPCAVVSGTFFDVLHARPFLGRTFRPADDQPSAPRVLVLSHALWAEHFGADPGVVGRTVLVQEEGPQQPFEIIGVMRAEYFYPRGAEYWTPAAPRLAAIARHRHEPLATWFENVGIFYGIGRMRGGVTEATTRAELVVLLDAISHELKIDLAGLGVTTAVTPLLEHIFGPARRALLVLTGAVSLVLLMACMNVAGLLFARGASRSREMAVRAALGASRGALVRQLLAESGLIACCGTVTGILIAAIVLQSIVALSPADIPRLDSTALDFRVLLLAVITTVVTTLLVGLAPAAQVSRTSLVSDLKGAATGVVARGSGARASRALVASQVAVTLVLLVGAGLCVQSFVRVAQLDLGFDPAHVLTFGVKGVDETRYPLPSQRADVVAGLLSRIERHPLVIAAAAVSQRPFEYGSVGTDSGYLVEGQPDTPEAWSRNPLVNLEAVTPHYFQAMRIRLLRGRNFDDRDTAQADRVVIVSEALATHVWPGENPIGKRLRANASEEGVNKPPVWNTVVGVVATARYRDIRSPRMDLYVPFRQTSDDVRHFVVKTTANPLSLATTINSDIVSVDRQLSMVGIGTMEQVVGRARGPWRFNMLVFSAFGVVALILAAAGLFALVGYEVNLRSREIGLRMALGATPRDVVRLMTAQAMGPAAIGLVTGLLAAVGMTRLLSSILFAVTPTDPATFAEVVFALLVVLLLASYLPASRAASVDPQVVLRDG